MTDQDIFEVVSNPIYQGWKLYFDPIEYPFDGDFKNSIVTWSKLSTQLFRTAAENWFHLLSNGIAYSSYQRYLFCSRYRTCKPSDARHNPANYRGSFIKSERRSGSRGPDGRKGAR
jgi:hypothetical protein